MSVIASREQDFECVGFGQRYAERCFQCNGPALYPVVRWRGHLNIIICAKCCARIKDGLLADITQVIGERESERESTMLNQRSSIRAEICVYEYADQ
jgi:hypothetical protein